MSQIQGIVVPGFFKPHQHLVGVRFPKGVAPTRRVKTFLRNIPVSSAEVTLDDRRNHRERAESGSEGTASAPLLLQAAAFTFSGLSKLGLNPDDMPSPAFKMGMAARSAMLGDPRTGPGSPATWKVGGPSRKLDALLIIAGDDPASVRQSAKKLVRDVRSAGLRVVYSEHGDVRSDLPGHEHFGFDDGISQPGIRGRASSKHRNDFITKRHIAPDQLPESRLFGYPGQDLVWPGAFVLGEPGAGPDPLAPGAKIPATPSWTTNGSYLVFRRLVQDVGLFWRTMRKLAKQLETRPGFTGIDENWLAARLVGRWQSGAPVNRVQTRDFPSLGKNRQANNHIRFDSNCNKLRLVSNYDDEFPMSTADPAGITCPWAAHVRKVNTRDSASDTGGRDSTYRRRILRVGIPFGKPLVDRFATAREDPHYCKRGLLFLSIQASIEEQFEFLCTGWMNDATRPKTPGGHDILVGQNAAPNENRERRCVIFGANVQQAEIRTKQHWVIPTGGEYLFVPSIPTLRRVLAKG